MFTFNYQAASHFIYIVFIYFLRECRLLEIYLEPGKCFFHRLDAWLVIIEVDNNRIIELLIAQ